MTTSSQRWIVEGPDGSTLAAILELDANGELRLAVERVGLHAWRCRLDGLHADLVQPSRVDEFARPRVGAAGRLRVRLDTSRRPSRRLPRAPGGRTLSRAASDGLGRHQARRGWAGAERRRGERWYVGGILAGPCGTMRAALSFLDAGYWSADLVSDDPNGGLRTSSRTVESTDELVVDAPENGGFAAILRPAPGNQAAASVLRRDG